ncbi:hypothetical protein BHQ15_11515 [Mycolicibacillus koreensis]|nr:hypothetical protein BHQ15_11515 [Mycolicibacillus koreensis]
MRTSRETRTFWWDRERPIAPEVPPLRAVVFDIDALGEIDADGDPAPRAGLIDLVMSLFVAGIWVAVVSTGRRRRTQAMVRELIGDGLVETIVTGEDLPDGCPRRRTEAHRLALWELGVPPEQALAVVGTDRALRSAAEAGLPAVVIASGRTPVFPDAAAVRRGYDGYTDGSGPLLAAGCQQLRRRWLADRGLSAAS